MKKILVIAVLSISIWASCSKSATTDSYTPSCGGTTKSYASDVAPLIQNYCGGCHNFGSYSLLYASRSSIRSAIAGGMMPRGGSFSNAQKDIIICWIDNGAPNN